MGLAGRASTNAASDVASGTNRVVLGHRPKDTAKVGWGSEAELVNGEEEEALGEVEDVTMTEIAPTPATETGTQTETRTLATNDLSDPAQLRYVVRVDHRGAGDCG